MLEEAQQTQSDINRLIVMSIMQVTANVRTNPQHQNLEARVKQQKGKTASGGRHEVYNTAFTQHGKTITFWNWSNRVSWNYIREIYFHLCKATNN